MVRRPCFEIHGAKALPASGVHCGVDKLCRNATPPVLVIDLQIGNINFAGPADLMSTDLRLASYREASL